MTTLSILLQTGLSIRLQTGPKTAQREQDYWRYRETTNFTCDFVVRNSAIA